MLHGGMFLQGVTPNTGLKHCLTCLPLDLCSFSLLARCVYQTHENFEILRSLSQRFIRPCFETCLPNARDTP